MYFVSSSYRTRYSPLPEFALLLNPSIAISRNHYQSVLSTGPSLKNRSDAVEVVELSLARRGVALASTTGLSTGAGVAFVVTGEVGGDD